MFKQVATIVSIPTPKPRAEDPEIGISWNEEACRVDRNRNEVPEKLYEKSKQARLSHSMMTRHSVN